MVRAGKYRPTVESKITLYGGYDRAIFLVLFFVAMTLSSAQQPLQLRLTNEAEESVVLLWVDMTMKPPQLIKIIDEITNGESPTIETFPDHQFVVQLLRNSSVGVQFSKGPVVEHIVIRNHEDVMTVSEAGSNIEFSTNRCEYFTLCGFGLIYFSQTFSCPQEETNWNGGHTTIVLCHKSFP